MVRARLALTAAVGGVAQTHHVDLEGYLRDDYLKVDYDITAKAAVEFGFAVLHPDGAGRRLRGCYVGYSHLTQDVICGRIDISRC